jgi:hypothetical protein
MIDKLEFANHNLPIACNLSLTEQAVRQDETEDIFGGYEEVKELSRGYAFRFPSGESWMKRLLDFIKAERECCPFFTFSLIFEPGKGPLWLQLEGSEEVKEFIRSQFKVN